MIMDGWTHGQPENRLPSAANCRMYLLVTFFEPPQARLSVPFQAKHGSRNQNDPDALGSDKSLQAGISRLQKHEHQPKTSKGGGWYGPLSARREREKERERGSRDESMLGPVGPMGIPWEWESLS